MATGAVGQACPAKLGCGVAPSHPPVPSPTYPGAAAVTPGVASVTPSLTLATDMASQVYQDGQVKAMVRGIEGFNGAKDPRFTWGTYLSKFNIFYHK